MHEESIPKRQILARLLSGKSENVIRSPSFPTVEDYFKEIGVMNLFESDDEISYGVDRDSLTLPVYYLKILDIRRNGTAKMYDIQVEETNSFLANGVVAHNCLLGAGVPYFAKDRLMDQSDDYQM